MASTQSPTGSVRRHMPRRSTRGPLDAGDDPLASPPANALPATPPQVASVASAPRASIEQSIGRPSIESVPDDKPIRVINLAFLQNPAIYHQAIPTEDIPPAFLEPSKQPNPGTPLQDLLQTGHFRLAARTALTNLLDCPPNDSKHVFELLYTRLACLVLISRPDLASDEAGPLLEFLARNPPGASEIVPLIPWELRLLLVRLQSIAAADGGRRGVMALYALGAEARQRITDAKAAGQVDQVEMWTARLKDLGLRVADTLVEMGELETATRHLDSLDGIDEAELAYRKALLRLRIGDVAGAKHCVSTLPISPQKESLTALLQIADGDYEAAISTYESQLPDTSSSTISNNFAISLLYTNRISQAKELLEKMAAAMPAFPGLLFNLSTVYELCTEQALERKNALAMRMAEKEPVPDTGGWERAVYEFKL